MTTSPSVKFDVQQLVAQLNNHLDQFFEKIQNFKNENPYCFTFFDGHDLSLNQIGIYVYTMKNFYLESEIIRSEVFNLNNRVFAILNSNNCQMELDQDTMDKVENISMKAIKLLQLVSKPHFVPQFNAETN